MVVVLVGALHLAQLAQGGLGIAVLTFDPDGAVLCRIREFVDRIVASHALVGHNGLLVTAPGLVDLP